MTRRTGPDTQLDALYREAGPAVLGYLTRRADAPGQAADLFGEVLVVLCRRRDDLPPPGEDRLWLFGIARHVLANHQRQAIRRREVTAALAAHLQSIVTEPVDVDHIIDLHAAIDNLPAIDREIVQLTTWEGFTSTEIGTLLTMPAATIRTRLHRALARLRHDLNLIDDDSDGNQAQPQTPMPASH